MSWSRWRDWVLFDGFRSLSLPRSILDHFHLDLDGVVDIGSALRVLVLLVILIEGICVVVSESLGGSCNNDYCSFSQPQSMM